MEFKNSYGKYSFDQVVAEINDFISDKAYEYELMVGSDSQRYGRKTLYITAIVIHRIGKFGKGYLLQNILSHNNHIDLSVRIGQEVTYGLEVVKLLEDAGLLKKIGLDRFEFHLDAGPNGASNKILSSYEGWVTSLGYKCVSKPDGWVSSHYSDRATKRKRHKIKQRGNISEKSKRTV